MSIRDEPMNEKELIKKAQAGDFEAFTRLVEIHKKKIYNLALRLTGNAEDAQDVFQDTLFKAIDNIDRFRGKASFGTWLYTIALNQARALHARSRQMELKPLEAYLPGYARSAESDHSSFHLFDWKDPEKVLEAEEIRRIIDDAIRELPFKYREAFVLRYIEELPIKEVAQLTNQSEAAAKSRVLRARLAMRDRLSTVFEDRYGKEL